MAKALLIKPTNSHFDRSHLQVNFEPLGLMCLSAFVKKYSAHKVAIIDAQVQSSRVRPLEDGRVRMGMDSEEIADAVREHQPDVVGISCLFERLEDDALEIARAVKLVSARIVVVAGGMDAAVSKDVYLKSGAVDLVVIGEGEETFLDILDAVGRGGVPTGIAGTFEADGAGGFRENPPRVARIPFDEYPYPDRDALPRSHYENRSNQRVSYPFSKNHPALLIQSSRGCSMKCIFCQIIAVCGQWRAHGAAYVVNEMEECIRKYGTREFIFLDDNFMLNPARVKEICDLIIERKLGVSIDILAGISVWTLSEPLIDRMIEAGLYRVILPVESGNPETLKFIGKPVDLDKTLSMIDYCNRRGLLTIGNLIIGFPFETEEDIGRTLAWGRRSGLDAIYYLVAQPIKGARMYAVYEDNGWLTSSHEGEAAYHSWWNSGSWRTQYFTADELGEIAARETSRHILRRILGLLRPSAFMRYLVPKIGTAARIRYVLRVALYVLLSGRGMSAGQKIFNIMRVRRTGPVTSRRRLG